MPRFYKRKFTSRTYNRKQFRAIPKIQAFVRGSLARKAYSQWNPTRGGVTTFRRKSVRAAKLRQYARKPIRMYRRR